MKKFFIHCLLWLFVPSLVDAQISAEELAAKAQNSYFEAVQAAQAEYRVKLAEVIAKADRAEIFLLDFETNQAKERKKEQQAAQDNSPTVDDENVKYFPVSPYGTVTRILDSRELQKAELERLVRELPKVIGVREYRSGAFCHFPIHGIRLYFGDSGAPFFESSLCWVCKNFSIDYLSYDSGWFGLPMDDTALEKLMQELMPIPEAEKKRFDAMMKK